MPNDEQAQQLQAEQRKRQAQEEQLKRSAPDEHEAAQHERRADKARYLRDKLAERTRSDRDAQR
jgi:hypothetical protein